MRDQLPAWISLRHIKAGMSFDGEIPLSRLSRWPEPGASGAVRLSLRVVQMASGRLGLEGEAQVHTELRCQRCMQAMPVRFGAPIALELVEDEEQARRVPDELDVGMAMQGRLELHELACDEALLAMPMMPRHPPGECAPPGHADVD